MAEQITGYKWLPPTAVSRDPELRSAEVHTNATEVKAAPFRTIIQSLLP